MCSTLLTCLKRRTYPIIGVTTSVQVGLVAAVGRILLLRAGGICVVGVRVATSLPSSHGSITATKALRTVVILR